MTPRERSARCESLARQVRRAVIELTHDDAVRLTSIPEVTRHLGVQDGYLLLDALELAARQGWMTVASGIISVEDRCLRAEARQARRAQAAATRQARAGRRRHLVATHAAREHARG